MNNQQSLFSTDRTLINHIWTKTTTHRNKEIWSAEASTLNGNRLLRPRNLCPKCDSSFMKKDMVGTFSHGRGDDAELAGWAFICPCCRVYLEVFND